MKKFLFLIIVLIISITAACSSPVELPSVTPESANQPEPIVNASYFNLSLATEPGAIKPNEPVKLIFSIQDALIRDVTLKDLEIVHEKPMHLIIISEDLSYFQHIHPVPFNNGTFSVETKFPAPGKYRFYLDYSPKTVGHRLGRVEITVPGTPPPPVPLVADSVDTKTVDGIRITIKPEKALRANDALTLNFYLADEQTGAPVTDIEPYLGAFAHFNIANQGHTEYLHAHPLVEAESPDARGGPEIGTRTIFPKPGLYKIWAQLQRRGKVIVAPFIVNVAEGGQQADAVIAKAESGVQKVKVTVSEKGFEPTSLKLKPGVPAQITFYRIDEKNCGHEVLVSDLGIRKDLPLNKEVLVEFTPTKSGSYEFTCGMGMLKGTIVIAN